MNPRIRKWRGIWHCFATREIALEPLPMGEGYDPEHAWTDWAQRTIRMWRAQA